MPGRILIVLVKNAAFVASASTNSFNFHHNDMKNLVLNVNGIQHPSEPVTMDCSSPFGATRAYETFSSTGIHHVGRAHDYITNVYKWVLRTRVDLTPDRESDEHIGLPLRGNVRNEELFKKPLPEPVTCILYAEFPGHI